MKLSDEQKNHIMQVCERKTCNGKLVKKIIALIKSENITDYIINAKSDFIWGFRKNMRGYANCERVGVVQHGENGNYWIFLNYNKGE